MSKPRLTMVRPGMWKCSGELCASLANNAREAYESWKYCHDRLTARRPRLLA